MTDKDIRALIDGALANMPAVTVPGIRWGVCDLDHEPEFGREYNRGVVVIIPYYRMLAMEKYTEMELALMLMTTYRMRLEVGNALREAFTGAGLKWDIPIVPKNHDTVYRVPLSVKAMAVRAGLGWIGRSDLLITEEYGPRFSLVGALLQAEELVPGVPVTESRCGECDLCVRACPFGNIKGPLWAPGRPREERVDYAKCSQDRFPYKEKSGRKLACGRCVVSCPYGTPAAPTARRVQAVSGAAVN